ncbi:acylhydrolase [Hymenobacter taeanensis]|uniref:Acylhydrolase n=1 Tax=Hymenobacter taeanensis TaxID=2735321 RepID=A0A6M6BJ28_9BACT|nr:MULTISPECIES: SGNH/GDSL hydrolase family protein [Hymenobacter]QJX48096.1 acylhydrolase [Hymenobacter taeanensis]UOQ82438.1 SGNH/GDSL hydrolase family protein [Hymenobacter sp. 5414T-23]
MKLVVLLALVLGLCQAPAWAQTAPTPDPLRTDWANLTRYATANKELPAPTAKAPRVVLLGNSITDSWPKTDPKFFAGQPYEFIGRGISGQTSPQMLLRFRQDVLELQPKVVAILAGTNDVAENTGPYNPNATLNNIKSMVELAQANGVRVVLCSVLPAYDFWWRKGLSPAPKIVALNVLIKAYARQKKLVYLDYHGAMADERQGLKVAYGEDGVHPNLAGYQVMEPLLQQAVADALKRKY